jgi:uncharacterized protein with HEPN domain
MDKVGRSTDELLVDVIVWGERIGRFTSGKTVDEFLANEILQLAVSKCIEAIGEASGSILRAHPGFDDEHPELELAEAYRMRNRLAHGYDTIDWLVVWDTVTVYIPNLVSRVRDIVSRNDG